MNSQATATRETRATSTPIRQAEVQIAVGPVLLHGTELLPTSPRGLVVLAHGDGGTRVCGPTVDVARRLAEERFGVLLVDLLTPTEDREVERRNDVALLAARLGQVTAWVDGQAALRALPLTYLGVGTGGAAALMAAAFLGERVRAVAIKDGRPDLAGPFLAHVRAPVLLLVSGSPRPSRAPDAGGLRTLHVNRQAMPLLSGRAELAVTPALDSPQEVARRVTGWLLEHAAT